MAARGNERSAIYRQDCDRGQSQPGPAIGECQLPIWVEPANDQSRLQVGAPAPGNQVRVTSQHLTVWSWTFWALFWVDGVWGTTFAQRAPRHLSPGLRSLPFPGVAGRSNRALRHPDSRLRARSGATCPQRVGYGSRLNN